MEKSDTFQERTNKKWGDNFFFVMRRRPTTTKAIYNQMNLKKCDKRHSLTKCVLLYCNQKAKENSPVRQVHTFEQFGQWNIDNRIVARLWVWRNNTLIDLIGWQQHHIRARIELNNGGTTFIWIGHWKLCIFIILCFGFKMWHHEMARVNDLSFFFLFVGLFRRVIS